MAGAVHARPTFCCHAQDRGLHNHSSVFRCLIRGCLVEDCEHQSSPHQDKFSGSLSFTPYSQHGTDIHRETAPP